MLVWSGLRLLPARAHSLRSLVSRSPTHSAYHAGDAFV
nr:MAG TPA: hypothetical protein [Bacteriophage sp.]